MSTTVLVADDNELLRAGLVTVLESDPDIAVVGQASDGRAAERLVARHRPDVVLMDVEMPGGDGITATRAIVDAGSATRVLVLTMFDLDEYVLEALRAGATGFLIKTTPPRELIEAVKACARGDTTLGPTVLARLVDRYVSTSSAVDVPGLADLTHREREVLRAMADGRSNAEVARELYLAETTVKTHVARILTKLGVRDRVQAVVLAHRAGLAGPRSSWATPDGARTARMPRPARSSSGEKDA
jgi:DNA-binding NarL/FixJ family response regulator